MRTTTARTLTPPLAVPRPRQRAVAAQRGLFRELAFVGLHVPLAIALSFSQTLAGLHALAVCLYGLRAAATPGAGHRAVLAAGYIAGAEVLWRMTGGNPVHEFGKYAIAFLLGVTVLQRGTARANMLAALYLLLLLPSAILTLDAFGLSFEARSAISFNLSGPIALAVATFCLSTFRADQLPLRQVLVAIVAPIVGIAAIAGRSTLTSADPIDFSTQSNFVTSGGFGPNQVSAALGLGAVLCLLLALQSQRGLARLAYLGLTLGLISQAVLTFSRGGVLNALVCVGLLGLYLLRSPRLRVAMVLALLLLGVVGTRVVLPALESFTGGALRARYSEIDPGLRRSLAEADIGIFADHPILGVGPGMAKFERGDLTRRVAAHTEHTRLLAEHGVLGLLALVLVMLIPVQSYWRAPTTLSRAWVVLMVTWPTLEMLHAAMRIGAISFIFALTAIRWTPPQAPPARTRRTPP